jgi:hypothetical protein
VNDNELWARFAKTGSIEDYLEYKLHDHHAKNIDNDDNV